MMLVAETSILVVLFVLSVTVNSALILTIVKSPCLRAPPNGLLLNFCAIDLLLSVDMVLSILRTSLYGSVCLSLMPVLLKTLSCFITVCCLLHYLVCFCCIAYFRGRVLGQFQVTLGQKKALVRKLLILEWVLALLLSSLLVLLQLRPLSDPRINKYLPFTVPAFSGINDEIKSIALCKGPENAFSEPNAASVASFAVLALLVLALVGYICRGYWVIVHSLAMTGPAVMADQFPPQAPPPPYRIGLDSVSVAGMDRDADFYARFCGAGAAADAPGQQRQRPRPSGGSVGSSPSVMQLRSFLRLPAEPSLVSLDSHRLSGGESMPAPQQLKTAADAVELQFTDISRSRRFSHEEALKRRRDQVSLQLAIRRSLVSFLLLLLPTLPYLVVCTPGLLAAETDQRWLAVHKTVTTLFYCNTVLVPLWYLLFSRRLRRCFVELVTGAS